MMGERLGQAMVDTHLGAMNAMSSETWPPIRMVDGIRIVRDIAYQGFDAGMHPWWTEPRFWCRSITVERVSDGARATGIGPQAEAYEHAVRALPERQWETSR
jgi:hypothetical protein